jgi:hypothetical protein
MISWLTNVSIFVRIYGILIPDRKSDKNTRCVTDRVDYDE